MANEVYLLDTKKGGKYFVGKKLGRAGDSYKILDISRDGTYGKKHEYGSVNHMTKKEKLINLKSRSQMQEPILLI